MKIAITVAFLLEATGLATAVAPATRDELQTEDLDTSGTMSELMSREEGHGQGRLICGGYANGDYNKIIDLIYDLDNDQRNQDFTIDAGQCNRVKCWDTSALYVCNDNPQAITLKGKQISISLKGVRLDCCQDKGHQDKIVNGQQFTPWGWNSNAGYGNCNDPVNIRPHMAGGHGVNQGYCFYKNWDAQSF